MGKSSQPEELGTVYLLHFDEPISALHTCQHYMGWTSDLEARLEAHRAGKGARLTAVARNLGIGFKLVKTWPNVGRTFERQLKNRKAGPRMCPLCKDARKAKKVDRKG